MEEQGQGYHKALEWMFDGFIAEEGLDYYSIEMFEYYHGISYTELGHKIKKDLEDLVQSNKKYIYNEHIDMAPEVEDQEEILNKEHDPLFQ
jgi:hypothetical protein